MSAAGETRDRPLRVAVSGIHLGENPQPGPGVIRSLREALGAGVSIVGLAYDALDSGLYADGLLDDAWLMPYPSAGPDAWLARLLEIRASGGLDVLISCLDVELPVISRLAPRLAETGIACVLPTADAFARRSKERLPELAREVGIAVPDTAVVADHASLADAGRRFGFPLLVKGLAYEADVVQGPVEAAASFDRLSAKWGLPLLAQRFVRGEEFDVIALGDGLGGMPGAVAMRKTLLSRLGKAWGAMTVDDRELIDTARRVVTALRWRGGCEVELLRAAHDGRLHLIEVNPRFPAWVYLATAAGVNLPLGLLRLARGEPLPEYPTPRAGVFYVRHAIEVLGGLQDLESLVALGRARPRPAPPGEPTP